MVKTASLGDVAGVALRSFVVTGEGLANRQVTTIGAKDGQCPVLCGVSIRLTSMKWAVARMGPRGGTRVNVLEDILAGVRADLAERQERVSLDRLKEIAAKQPTTRNPLPLLRAPGVSVIAELKRRSPSKGQLAQISDPAALARDYEAGGAAAISVVTERRRFGGTLDDLRAVRASVETPILCKDFILTSYQLWEARACGADLALLLVVALEQNALVSLIERAESIGLTPLVECHNAEEVERAVDAGARLIGINARDLTTLKVHRDTFARLAPLIPDGIIKIAESGVRGPHDVIELAREGADAVLVGESLVTGKDPRSSVADLVAAGAHPALRQGRT